MATKLAQVEKEKEVLNNDLLHSNEEVDKLKETNTTLQHKFESHVCIILVQVDYKDPAATITQVMTKLNIAKSEMKKNQNDFDNEMKVIKATEHELYMEKESS